MRVRIALALIGTAIGALAVAGLATLLVLRVTARADAEVKGHVPFADGAKDAREGSLGVAMRLGHNYIGTEHILLALLEVDGLAAQALTAQGVTSEAAEAEVVDILQGLAP